MAYYPNDTKYTVNMDDGSAVIYVPTSTGTTKKLTFTVDDVPMLADILANLIKFDAEHPEAC